MTTSIIYKQIPIDCLQRGRYQPRVKFDEESLKELAQSILTQGLIEPLVVRKCSDTAYEIIAGERRWRAAMMAGLSEVPCLIGEYSDSQAAAVTLIENIQRQNLSLLEEAHGYQRLMAEFHFHQHEIGTLVGKSRSHVANLLRLLTLCSSVQEHIHLGQLSLGHARMLVGLRPDQQELLARNIIDHQWSVRKLENEVRVTKLTPSTTHSAPNERDIQRLEGQLSEQIGAPVHVDNDHETGGWLKIKFYDNDTLSGLLDRMGLRYD
jgi:ParB family transcriptional regulator, chromosome partitioning protein